VTSVELRLLSVTDAEKLDALLARNREHLAPWDPVRPEAYFSLAGQREEIGRLLEQYEKGSTVPWVILADGAVAGRITLSNLVRGPLLSANIGYWVDVALNGHGVASAALSAAAAASFGEHGLHRLEAGTLVHNLGSQRVLEKNGFVRYGLAPKLLKIGGLWQDHVLFQLINEALD
jgi:ribosomal-protein-alanine N-acetyltransferase